MSDCVWSRMIVCVFERFRGFELFCMFVYACVCSCMLAYVWV